MKAAIYARYSTDLQREASIDDQIRVCRRRSDAEGWTITATFADAAMSGSDANRPQYQALLAAAARREFDILLIEDLSRLTRDSVEQERTIRRLEFHGIRLVGVSDGYDSNSKARKVHRGMKGLMNELYIDDLREKVHRGLAGQAVKGRWCGGRPYAYYLRPILDRSQTDAYGQPAKIGTRLEVNPEQAAIVKEMFERYAAGESTRAIAADLNRRGVPSPGSTWKRKVRRCNGWAGSAVRAILVNNLFTGVVTWNTSQFVRDPDTNKYKRRARPRSEWHEHRDESLRIVTDALFKAAQERTRPRTNDPPVMIRSKPKYLLSGLLKCECGAHFVMVNQRSYGCGGHLEGACDVGFYVRRDHAEQVILDPIQKELLAPDRVKRMANEMQRANVERLQSEQARAAQAPREIQALDTKIARLRERQRLGDPDMTADELQTIIDRVLAERRKLEDAQPAARQGAKLAAMLPNAAELYRKQIEDGLDGDPRAAAKARVVLRKLLGPILLEQETDGSVWARYEVQPGALLAQAVGNAGRGDRI